MLVSKILSLILRLAELAAAFTVVVVNGNYLRSVQHVSPRLLWRFIFAEVVAAFAALLAVIWMLPFSNSFIHWPADFFVSVCWFIVFGVLVQWIGGHCGNIFNWEDIFRGSCGTWKAIIALSFISAFCWLVSACLGIYWTRRYGVRDDRYYDRAWYRPRYGH